MPRLTDTKQLRFVEGGTGAGPERVTTAGQLRPVPHFLPNTNLSPQCLPSTAAINHPGEVDLTRLQLPVED